jgi:hypothetical protein
MDAYGYCYQNPINLVDPLVMSADPPGNLDFPDGTVPNHSESIPSY